MFLFDTYPINLNQYCRVHYITYQVLGSDEAIMLWEARRVRENAGQAVEATSHEKKILQFSQEIKKLDRRGIPHPCRPAPPWIAKSKSTTETQRHGEKMRIEASCNPIIGQERGFADDDRIATSRASFGASIHCIDFYWPTFSRASSITLTASGASTNT